MATPNKQVTIPTEVPSRVANPRRIAAGRLNRAKRKGLTPEGLERLRQSALRNEAWRFSTGPRTPEGRAKVARNGKKRQLGPQSVREIKQHMASLLHFLDKMRVTRQAM